MDQLSAHLDRGWDLLNRGDFLGAQTSAEKSLELDAQSPEVHNLLGYIQAAQGNTHEALKHYRQAIALDNTFLEAILNTAELLIHPIKNFDEAAKMVNDAIKLAQSEDEIADALLLKFDVCMQQSNLEASAKIAAILPEGPFENPCLDFLIGRAKFEVNDLSGARQILQRSVKQNPDYPDSHYYLGQIYASQGDSDLALIEFLKSRALEQRAPGCGWSLPLEEFERRVKNAIQQLPDSIAKILDGTLVVVSDLPGAEVITEGIDPRVGILIDEDTTCVNSANINRIFIYQRNIEKMVSNPIAIEEKLKELLETELSVSR